jgi:hypothetical protein
MGRGKVSETASGVVIRSRQLMSTVLYPSGSDAKWNVVSASCWRQAELPVGRRKQREE